MSESSIGIHPKKLKNFVRHICVVAKKHKDREEARSDLGRQIKKLKKFSSGKKGMDKELKELDRKISLVLEKEKQLLGIRQEETFEAQELMHNVIGNREKIMGISDSINDLKGRLQDYIGIKTERERRINELEKKIRSNAGKKKDVSLLKNKLKSLEALYTKLKNKGVDVSRVESRIESLKLRLNFS